MQFFQLKSKYVRLKPTTITISLAFLLVGLTGCMSSESQAENTQTKTAKVTEKNELITTASNVNTNNVAQTQSSTEKKKEPSFIEGKHYVEIFPEMQTDPAPGKVEVIELFWLGCPHCYDIEPTMKQYKEKMPAYIDFKQESATFNATWRAHAKAFYTAQALDPSNKLKLIDKMFYAIHKQGRNLLSANSQKRFFKQHGIEEKAFDNTFNSMLIKTKLAQAAKISDSSQATSVPSVIIAGKYRTSPHMAGNTKKLLEVINFLTKKVRDKK